MCVRTYYLLAKAVAENVNDFALYFFIPARLKQVEVCVTISNQTIFFSAAYFS